MPKNIVITGGNSGIGLETARGLYGDGHSIIIGSRNEQKSLEAIKNIQQSRPQSTGSIKYFSLDLAKRESVERFASSVKEDFRHLDILINNSGLIRNEKQLDENGIELTYMINHFGHFYLTQLLFSLLQKAPEARIINVASSVHSWTKQLITNDLSCNNGWGAFQIYSRSKLANVMFSVSLAEKLTNRPKIKAMSLHPGIVDTDFQSRNCCLKFLSIFCLCCIIVKSQKGATTSLYLSRVEFDKLKSGAYYDDDTSIGEMNKIAQDKVECQKLWQASQKVYGIKFDL